MLNLPCQYLQHIGGKQLHANCFIMPRWYVRAGAVFVRPLYPGVLSHHAWGAVRRGVHAVPFGVVEHFVGRHVCSGLRGVSTGVLQRHAQCNQPQHLPGLPYWYIFCSFWRAGPLLMP